MGALPTALSGRGIGLMGILVPLSLAACSSMPMAKATSPTRTSAATQEANSPTLTTTSAPATIKCTATNLKATAAHQGGGYVGETLISVLLTNVAQSACSLAGLPSVGLAESSGMLLQLAVNPRSTPELRTVVLEPGAGATLEMYWANWCAQTPGLLSVRISLTGETTSIDAPFGGLFSPECQDAAQPSTLSVSTAYLAES